MKTFPALTLGILLSVACLARADQIEMQNGDRYHGKVLAMTNATLVLQSEILGTITIPREKVSQINLGNTVRTKGSKRTSSVQSKALLPTAPGGVTNSSAGASSADQSKLIGQVQDQFLAG